MFYFLQMIYPNRATREELIALAKIPNVSGLKIKEIHLGMETATAFGGVTFDIRTGEPGALATIYDVPGDRPTIATGELDVIQSGLDIPVNALENIGVYITSLPVGGAGYRITASIKLDDEQAAVTTETLQDMIASFLVAGTNVNIVYNDAGNSLTFSATDTTVTTEQIQDIVAAMLTQGTNVTLTYNDAANTLEVAATGGGGGGTLAGDVSGAAGSNVVDKLQNYPLTMPTYGATNAAPIAWTFYVGHLSNGNTTNPATGQVYINGNYWWYSGARGIDLPSGYAKLSMTPGAGGNSFFAGLTVNMAADYTQDKYLTLDFCFHKDYSGQYRVYESGVLKYSTGLSTGVLDIERTENGSVLYYVGGVLVYTSLVSQATVLAMTLFPVFYGGYYASWDAAIETQPNNANYPSLTAATMTLGVAPDNPVLGYNTVTGELELRSLIALGLKWATISPDAFPVSPSIYDDEFNASSLDLTKWQNNNSVNTGMALGSIRLTMGASDPAEPRSILQNIASQVGTFRAKVCLLGNDTGQYKGGMIIRQGANDKSRFIGLHFVSGTLYLKTWSGASNAAGLSQVTSMVYFDRTVYVKAVNNGTTLELSFSTDGTHYIIVETLTLSSYFTGNATYIGLFVEGSGNSAGVGITSDWIRFT